MQKSDEWVRRLGAYDEMVEAALEGEGCGKKIGPYNCCTVVQGDCLELMKALPDGVVDAVITDPPYGIKANCYRENGWGKAAITRDYGSFGWDEKLPMAIPEIRRISQHQIIFGGNYYADLLPPSGGWLIWDKLMPEGLRFADCELAWTSLIETAPRKLNWLWNGMIRQDNEERFHPTQKPLGVMLWANRQLEAATILDPFAGSGTTLVAAKKLGRHFLGFEISAEYCAIARRRIAEIDAQPSLFEPKPEQLSF